MPVESASLSGQTAFITGAGRGVGRATAHLLASRGAAIAVNDVNDAAARETVEQLHAKGFAATTAIADVTDYEQVGDAVAQSVTDHGRLDILVNNAGNVGTDPRGWTLKLFWETTPDEWQSFVDVNLFGVMNCCRHVLPVMIDQGDGGRIVTVVSDAARVGEPRLEAYTAAKAGAAGFMRSLAKSAARFDITANSVALGTMTSAGYDSMDPAELAQRMKPYLVRRPGLDSEAAAMVGHIVGPDGAWITGQTYPVNGGISTS
jgi:2-hydroxycyclohexanecarboxyl-CoA dehydrogenase